MKLYVAKNESGRVHLFTHHPERGIDRNHHRGMWQVITGTSWAVPQHCTKDFPGLTWENSPAVIEIKLLENSPILTIKHA